jgi:hypothetical protein
VVVAGATTDIQDPESARCVIGAKAARVADIHLDGAF